MFDHIFSNGVKLVGIVGAGLAGVTISESAHSDQSLLVTGIERMGSFALIAVFVLAILWGLGKLVPQILAGLEKTKDQFLSELKEERASREKSVEAFREMLGAHKNDLGEKLDEGNRITRELVAELKCRPCQKISNVSRE
jgi:hypothetical protein